MTMTRLNRPLRRPVPLLLCVAAIAVTCTGCAHSSSTQDSMPAKESAAMTASESKSTTDNPTLTAEEIGKLLQTARAGNYDVVFGRRLRRRASSRRRRRTGR